MSLLRLFKDTLLLAMLCHASASSCPNTCVCRFRDTITCSYLEPNITFRNLIFRGFSMHLELHNMTRINAITFNGTERVKDLSVSGNRITYVSSNTFKEFTTLTGLYIHNTLIRSVHVGMFHGLLNLIRLFIFQSKISTIEKGTFKGLQNLKELSLKENRLQSIELSDFGHLPKLTVLNLEKNEISSVTRKNDTILENLRVMYLNENRLKSISYHVLEGVPNINKIYLTSNDIKSLQNMSFQSLTNLEQLFLSYNRITLINKTDFEHLRKLKTLLLDHNKIKSLDKDAFKDLTHLQTLHLEYNNISLIHNFMFSNQNRLLRLNLKGNILSSINRDAFSGLNQSHSLDLSENRIKRIDKQAFECFLALKEILLNNNYIESIILNSKLPLLKNVNLSGNKLTQIERETLSDLVNVRNLYLSHNNISYIEDGTFERLTTLRYVTLNNNNLMSLPNDFRNSKHIIMIDLHQNNLKCSCYLIMHLKTFRNVKGNCHLNNTVLNFGIGDVFGFQPVAYIANFVKGVTSFKATFYKKILKIQFKIFGIDFRWKTMLKDPNTELIGIYFTRKNTSHTLLHIKNEDENFSMMLKNTSRSLETSDLNSIDKIDFSFLFLHNCTHQALQQSQSSILSFFIQHWFLIFIGVIFIVIVLSTLVWCFCCSTKEAPDKEPDAVSTST